MFDNTATTYGINNMGCHTSDLCNQIFEIWSWTEKSNIWITTAYIPGMENLNADGEYRKKRKYLEWILNRYYQKNFTFFI